MQSYKEKVKAYSNKDSNVFKLTEISEKQCKQIDALKTQTTILTEKLDNRRKRVEYLRDENEKLFQQLKDATKKHNQLSTTGPIMGTQGFQQNFQKMDKQSIAKEVETNPSLLKEYRRMIEEKDKIVSYTCNKPPSRLRK